MLTLTSTIITLIPSHDSLIGNLPQKHSIGAECHCFIKNKETYNFIESRRAKNWYCLETTWNNSHHITRLVNLYVSARKLQRKKSVSAQTIITLELRGYRVSERILKLLCFWITCLTLFKFRAEVERWWKKLLNDIKDKYQISNKDES